MGWRSPCWRYNAARVQTSPTYVGSYALDCLCMALHCTWTTSSLKAAVLKAANLCADADTVAAVTGQLAGSIYGASSIPHAWVEAVHAWDHHGDIEVRAYKLFHRK